MRSPLILLLSILIFSSCKKEENSSYECDLTTNSTLSKNWNCSACLSSNPQAKINISMNINDNHNYTFDYKISFFDVIGGAMIVSDSISGNESGSLQWDYCHSTPSDSNGQPFPGIFMDKGDIIFSPDNSDNYTSYFDADINHFSIHDLKLDTFKVYIGFSN